MNVLWGNSVHCKKVTIFYRGHITSLLGRGFVIYELQELIFLWLYFFANNGFIQKITSTNAGGFYERK